MQLPPKFRIFCLPPPPKIPHVTFSTPPSTMTTTDLFSSLCVCVCVCVCTLSRSIMSSSLQPQGLQPTRLLCPWDFPAKNPGVGSHFLLQGVFLIQGLNPHLLHWQVDSSPLSRLGSPFFPIVLPFSECHTDGSIQSVLSNLASFIPHGVFLLLSHISGTDVPVKYGM